MAIHKEDNEISWTILYDYAKSIRVNMEDFRFGHTPVEPLSEDAEIGEMIRGVKRSRLI